MDLELSDEQVWLEESINTLLDRQWPPARDAWQAGAEERARLWDSLVEFGVLGGPDGHLGAIELCLAARALGGHLASVPFLGSVGVRYAIAPFAAQLPDGFAALLDGDSRVAIALLEPGARLGRVRNARDARGQPAHRHESRRRACPRRRIFRGRGPR